MSAHDEGTLARALSSIDPCFSRVFDGDFIADETISKQNPSFDAFISAHAETQKEVEKIDEFFGFRRRPRRPAADEDEMICLFRSSFFYIRFC